MTVDYKLIADNDPGGDLESAFNTMSAETVSIPRGEYRITDITVANNLGLNDANQFLDAVEAATPARVHHWMRTSGIDINHQDTINTLTAINPPFLTEVLALGNEDVCTYGRNFKIGHLQNARQWRSEGKI